MLHLCNANDALLEDVEDLPNKFSTKGFVIGGGLKVTRRMSFKFGDKQERKDVGEGSLAKLEGFKEEKFVVRFRKDDLESVALVKPCNVVPAELAGDFAEADDAQGALGPNSKKSEEKKSEENLKPFPDLPYLKLDQPGQKLVVLEWAEKQTTSPADKSGKMRRLRNVVSFALSTVVDLCPAYTKQDITIARRDSTVEVYANRNFAKGELMLAPDATELRDRAYSGLKCAWVGNVADVHPEKRHIVIDGRMCSQVADTKTFALFWLIPKGETAKECNCVVKHLNMSVTVFTDAAKLGALFKTLETEKGVEHDANTFPQVPIITNSRIIPKGEKFVVWEDAMAKAVAHDRDLGQAKPPKPSRFGPKRPASEPSAGSAESAADTQPKGKRRTL